MARRDGTAQPLPMRQAQNGTWEVENSPGNWVRCHTEEDARMLSNAPIVLDRSYRTQFPDNALATELEETAAILEEYTIGWGSRFMRWRAQCARGEESD